MTIKKEGDTQQYTAAGGPEGPTRYKVDDKMTAKVNMDEWTDTHGNCRCAAKGETLIVREVRAYPMYLVSHENRTDGMTFAAYHDELEPTSGS